MKKLKLRAMAWAMLLTFLLSSSVGTAVEAAETVAVTAATVEAKNLMEVTKAELASGKVLYVTADMLDVDGNLVIADGSWEKIVIAKEVMAEKVTLRGVTATELVVESGTKCVVQVEKATVGTLTVAKPQLEHIGYTEICTMLDSGMDAVEVVKIYKNYLDTKARLESIPVTITTGADSTVQTLAVSGSSKLELGNGKVAEVKIESGTVDNHLRVSVAGYDGKVSVDQKKTEQGSFNIVNLEIKDSNLSELTISGGGTCTVAKQGDSKVGNVSVSGSTSVQLRVPAEKVSVDEKSEKVSLKLYSDVGELSAEGDDVKIAVSSSAKIDNQENVSSDVKVSVGIKSPGTSSSSSSSKPKPKPTATPKPEPMPDEDEPTVTPDPTPDVEEPTVTPDPTPGAGEDDGKDDPSDYPEITPGGDDPTESNTGGALKPGDGNEEEPTPTPTPGEDEKEESTPTPTSAPTPTSTPAPTPTSTPAPTSTPTPTPTSAPTSTPTPTPDEDEKDEPALEYTPEEWFSWYEEEGGVVIEYLEIPYDEESGELVDFGGTIVIPETIEDMPVVGIGEEAFWLSVGSEYITELILPESLKFISWYAFEGTAVTNITLPENLETIDECAFSASLITTITIPASVSNIGDYAFEDTAYLEEIFVDEENENYSSVDGCLYDKDATTLIKVPEAMDVTVFEIPDGVECVADYAFCYMEQLETIVLGADVKEFGYNCYSMCDNLQDVEVSEENNYFEDYGNYVLTEDKTSLIFAESSVTEFEIPKEMTDFNMRVLLYSGCLPLDSVTVESGNTSYIVNEGIVISNLEEIVHFTGEADAYYEAMGYTSFETAENITTIGAGAFYGCKALSEISVSDRVTEIDVRAFTKCSNLKELQLSANITMIPSGMCRDCVSLSEIIIPEGVTDIRASAFYGCSSLEYIYFPDTMERRIPTSAIIDIAEGAVLSVKADTKLAMMLEDFAEDFGYEIEYR